MRGITHGKKKKGRKSIRRFLESNTKGRDDEEGVYKGERGNDRREERSEDGEGGKQGKIETMEGEMVNVYDCSGTPPYQHP